MDYKAQGPEKCTASILFDSTFGRPLYSSGMQFFTDHIALMEMGERSMEADSVRDPLIRGEEGAVYRGNRVLPSPAPSPPPRPPHRPQGVWLVRGGLRQWPPWQLFACFLRFVCPSAFYTSCPITLPQIPCILTLTRLRTLRGSFKSFSV